MGKNKRLYVLDTNVLMHDPTSLFRFDVNLTVDEAARSRQPTIVPCEDDTVRGVLAGEDLLVPDGAQGIELGTKTGVQKLAAFLDETFRQHVVYP